MKFVRGLVLLLCCSLGAGAQSWGLFGSTLGHLWHGTETLPAYAIRNWRVTVPLVIGTGLLMAYGDPPASGSIHSVSLETSSNRWSTRGLVYIEPLFLLSAAAYQQHCLLCAREFRFAEQEAAAVGYSSLAVQAMKYTALRERPNVANDGDGGFWQGGASFPSGHAMAAFTMASVFAHDFPQNRWGKWTAYGLSGGIAGLRFTAKEHFPSDLVVGAGLGFLAGRCAVTCGP